MEAGPSGEGDEGQTGEEEETDLKLAWEVLELARVICQRYNVHHNESYKHAAQTSGKTQTSIS